MCPERVPLSRPRAPPPGRPRVPSALRRPCLSVAPLPVLNPFRGGVVCRTSSASGAVCPCVERGATERQLCPLWALRGHLELARRAPDPARGPACAGPRGSTWWCRSSGLARRLGGVGPAAGAGWGLAGVWGPGPGASRGLHWGAWAELQGPQGRLAGRRDEDGFCLEGVPGFWGAWRRRQVEGENRVCAGTERGVRTGLRRRRGQSGPVSARQCPGAEGRRAAGAGRKHEWTGTVGGGGGFGRALWLEVPAGHLSGQGDGGSRESRRSSSHGGARGCLGRGGYHPEGVGFGERSEQCLRSLRTQGCGGNSKTRSPAPAAALPGLALWPQRGRQPSQAVPRPHRRVL